MQGKPSIVSFYHLDISRRSQELSLKPKKGLTKKQSDKLVMELATKIHADSVTAHEYDIDAFCFYVEAHAGAKLAFRSIYQSLEFKTFPLKFSVCWVNQVWLRSYSYVTESPDYQFQDHQAFIVALLPALKHPNYQKFNGKPIVSIFNLQMLENISEVTSHWRQYCIEHGVGDIHIAAVEQRDKINLKDTGIDSFIEFPLNRYGLKNKPDLNLEDDDEIKFQAILYDYEQMVVQSLTRPQPPYPTHRGVLVGWDDSALKGRTGFCFKNVTTANYKAWLHGLIKQAEDEAAGQPLLFIHAWNDNLDQSALAPKNAQDYGYLDATQQAIRGSVDWRMLIDYAHKQGKLEGVLLEKYLSDLVSCFESQEKALAYQAKVQKIKQQYFIQRVIFTEKVPEQLKQGRIKQAGEAYLDKVNSRDPSALSEICVEKDALVRLQGWAVLDGATLDARTNNYFVFENTNKQHYFAFVHGRQLREDVSESKPSTPKAETLYCGFSFHADFSKLPKGLYRLGIMQESKDNEQYIAYFDKVFNLV